MTVTEIQPREDFTRTPPHDIRAEQIVVGAMIHGSDPNSARAVGDAIADVTSVMIAEDHYRPAHQILHETILDLHDRGEPTDPVAICAALMKSGQLGKTGGAPYLHTLMAVVPTAINAGYYARIVREHATMRRVIETGARMVQMGYAADADSAEAVSRAQAELDQVTARHAHGADLPMFGDLLNQVIDGLESEPPWRLPTGLPDLDAILRIAASSFTVIAARPAVGKTSVALNLAIEAAIETGQPAVFFSLEMSRQELMLRAISRLGRIEFGHLTTGRLTDDDWHRLAQARGLLADLPLIIDDTPGHTMGSIRAALRQVTRLKTPCMAVVDYLQLVSSPGRSENRQQEVAAFSRGFKLLARETGIPLVALAQLNRGPEHRMDKRPALSDLRESGQIEQDADNVVLIHRDDAYEKESPRAGEMDFIIAKQRNGPTGTATVTWQGHFQRVASLSRDWSPSSALNS